MATKPTGGNEKRRVRIARENAPPSFRARLADNAVGVLLLSVPIVTWLVLSWMAFVILSLHMIPWLAVPLSLGCGLLGMFFIGICFGAYSPGEICIPCFIVLPLLLIFVVPLVNKAHHKRLRELHKTQQGQVTAPTVKVSK